jgi:hypothetical protein
LRPAVGRPQMQDHNLMKIQGNLFDMIYPVTDPLSQTDSNISLTKLRNLFVIIIIIIIIIKHSIKEVDIFNCIQTNNNITKIYVGQTKRPVVYRLDTPGVFYLAM